MTGAPHKQLIHWVADKLREDVLDGRLAPGEWLRQARLAEQHQVSQTPVREALKQLVSEGLLEHVPYRGIRVVQFSVGDVEDLYECRALVESIAARHAARVITGEEIAQIESLHLQMLACVTPNQLKLYRDLNRRFHAAIYTASRRSFLVRTLGQLWAAFPTMLWSNLPRVADVSVPGREEPDAREHAEIVASLKAHDPRKAEKAVRRHIESSGQALAAAMTARP